VSVQYGNLLVFYAVQLHVLEDPQKSLCFDVVWVMGRASGLQKSCHNNHRGLLLGASGTWDNSPAKKN